MDDGNDPILVQRARIARLVDIGQRLGYGLFGGAAALFVVGAVSGFTSPITTLVVVALVAGSLVLAPAIVLGYAVRAAERDERASDDDAPPP